MGEGVGGEVVEGGFDECCLCGFLLAFVCFA